MYSFSGGLFPLSNNSTFSSRSPGVFSPLTDDFYGIASPPLRGRLFCSRHWPRSRSRRSFPIQQNFLALDSDVPVGSDEALLCGPLIDARPPLRRSMALFFPGPGPLLIAVTPGATNRFSWHSIGDVPMLVTLFFRQVPRVMMVTVARAFWLGGW